MQRLVTNALAIMCLHSMAGLPSFGAEVDQPPKSPTLEAPDESYPASACWQVVVYDADHDPICIATAFAVAEHLLATNAHVVEAVAEGLREGGSASVVQHDTGVTFDIVWLWKHPGYRGDDSIGPDVGLLSVNEPLPAILRLADAENLHRISPFDPVRMYGFPGDVARSIDLEDFAVGPVRPRATAAVGIITAMRPFRPLQDATPDSSLVVQHDLRSVGGNSGSPILNDDGKVVAVNAQASKESSPRLGLAIRSDVLDGLLRMVRLGVLPTVDTVSVNIEQEGPYDSGSPAVADDWDPILVYLLTSLVSVGVVGLTLIQLARIRGKPQRRLLEAITQFVETYARKAASTEAGNPTRLTGESNDAKPE
jgi:hypothetical protein